MSSRIMLKSFGSAKMPSAQFHINKAKRNEKFYCSHKLETSGYNEWAITVLFYILLHYVDAVLSQDTNLSRDMQNPHDHKKRKKAITLSTPLSPISIMYLNMCDRSWEARYQRLHFPDNYFNKLVSLVSSQHTHIL